jgi:hypothetical protein
VLCYEFNLKIILFLLDVHEYVHCDMIMKVTKKMQLYRLIYYSQSALRVLGDVFAHHQEHLTVFTASGNSSIAGRGLPDHDQQHCYRHVPTVKPKAANAAVSS